MTQKTREKLTRERVVEAALRVLDAEGIEAVTMRRVAREVGVEAMSLYNHVRDKEDLLDAVVEHVLLDFPTPDVDPSLDWSEYGRQVARGWRSVLIAHPHVLPLLAGSRSPVANPDAMLPMETALRALREAGLSDRDAVQAFHAIGGYIFGFVLMESGQVFGTPGGGGAPGAPMVDLPADQLPCVTACLPYLLDCNFDEQFEFGLDLMIEGLRAKTGVPAR